MSNEHADQHGDSVEIFINTVSHFVPKGLISFAEVVRLAENVTGDAAQGYSVAYDRGHDDNPEDTLPFGAEVKVKKGMRFDVFPTGRS